MKKKITAIFSTLEDKIFPAYFQELGTKMVEGRRQKEF